MLPVEKNRLASPRNESEEGSWPSLRSVGNDDMGITLRSFDAQDGMVAKNKTAVNRQLITLEEVKKNNNSSSRSGSIGLSSNSNNSH